jgi:hypothetical protein
MRSKSEIDDVQVLDEWYQKRGDGMWEHRFGVCIESCDNPGWQITFTDLPLPADGRADLLETLRHEDGAEVIIDAAEVRVFSRSLRTCLSAATKLIEISGHCN